MDTNITRAHGNSPSTSRPHAANEAPSKKDSLARLRRPDDPSRILREAQAAVAAAKAEGRTLDHTWRLRRSTRQEDYLTEQEIARVRRAGNAGWSPAEGDFSLARFDAERKKLGLSRDGYYRWLKHMAVSCIDGAWTDLEQSTLSNFQNPWPGLPGDIKLEAIHQLIENELIPASDHLPGRKSTAELVQLFNLLAAVSEARMALITRYDWTGATFTTRMELFADVLGSAIAALAEVGLGHKVNPDYWLEYDDATARLWRLVYQFTDLVWCAVKQPETDVATRLMPHLLEIAEALSDEEYQGLEQVRCMNAVASLLG